jgi:hypothetical protein
LLFIANLLLSVYIAAVADIDHYHKEPALEDPVNNTVAPHSPGTIPPKRSFQRLALKRIYFQQIKNMGHAAVKTAFPVRHAPQDRFRLMGQLQLISFQGNP